MLQELPAAATQKLLALLSPEERKIATELLGYPKNSIGRRMTPRYVAIQQNWTVAEVFAELRKQNHKRDAMNQLYVTDSKGRLVDFVRLRDLVVVPPQTSVLELLENQQIFLRATDDQETAVAAFKKYDVTMLPVVDSSEVLVGVVTVDDVLDVAEKAATEDIQRLGGVQALDAPYLKTERARHGQKTRAVAGGFVCRRNAHVRDDAKLWRRSSKDCRAFVFHAADSFVRRQFRFAGHFAHHSRDGGGRCFVERLVASFPARTGGRFFAGLHSGCHRRDSRVVSGNGFIFGITARIIPCSRWSSV